MTGGRAELLEGGKSLGRYRILKKLGAGGMGEVFVAEKLLSSLARIDGLKVASRSSAFSFKGKDTKNLGISDRRRRA